MNRYLSFGFVGLVSVAFVGVANAQSRNGGYYTQRIGAGALTPNARTLNGSTVGYSPYGIGPYGYGLGNGYRGYAYGSSYGYNTARPAQVTWYSVAGGYSTGPQTGVPWRGGGPRTEQGRDVLPDSPIEGLARSRTVTGRDYMLASKLARAKLSADKTEDSTAVPVSSRRVETNDKKSP